VRHSLFTRLIQVGSAGLIVLALSSCSCGTERFPVTISGVTFSIEVVDTPETRARGLMYREEMGEREGMLFVFEEEEPRSFYMANTLIPLSIAYISNRFVIREIHDMDPLSPTPVSSRFPAMYALEVNQGAFERAGVAVGDRLVVSDGLAGRIDR
jgi:uncharacterized membrane protein (UPF0127 family)